MVEKKVVSKPKGRRRIVEINSASRPGRVRGTESVSEPCSLCGSLDWETDDSRGETTCGTCGYVALQNMIDPGAEWTNHSDGDDRSRVGAPTRIDLSDKGLNTSIDRRDISAGKHGMSARQARDWRRRQVIDQRSKTRDSRSRNLSQAMQFIKNHGGLPAPDSATGRGPVQEVRRERLGDGQVNSRGFRGVRLRRCSGGPHPKKDRGRRRGIRHVERSREEGAEADHPPRGEDARRAPRHRPRGIPREVPL